MPYALIADKQREIFEEFRQLGNPERDRRDRKHRLVLLIVGVKMGEVVSLGRLNIYPNYHSEKAREFWHGEEPKGRRRNRKRVEVNALHLKTVSRPSPSPREGGHRPCRSESRRLRCRIL